MFMCFREEVSESQFSPNHFSLLSQSMRSIQTVQATDKRVDFVFVQNTHPVRRVWCLILWKREKVFLWHTVSLLSLQQAGLVRVQHSEWRVVLKCCDDSGANIVLLVQKPNYCRYSYDGHHAENDQGGEQCTRLLFGFFCFLSYFTDYSILHLIRTADIFPLS